MPDSIAGPLTLFDAAAVALVIISALMAVARGFMRELATLGAFVAAVAATFYVHMFVQPPLAGVLPSTLPDWTATAIIIVIVFMLVYVFAAWAGQKLSKSVNGPEGLGPIDRIAGLIFGIARAWLVLVFAVLLMKLVLKQEQIPSQIADAKVYPILNVSADYVISNAPRIANNVKVVLPDNAEQAN